MPLRPISPLAAAITYIKVAEHYVDVTAACTDKCILMAHTHTPLLRELEFQFKINATTGSMMNML